MEGWYFLQRNRVKENKTRTLSCHAHAIVWYWDSRLKDRGPCPGHGGMRSAGTPRNCARSRPCVWQHRATADNASLSVAAAATGAAYIRTRDEAPTGVHSVYFLFEYFVGRGISDKLSALFSPNSSTCMQFEPDLQY